MNVFLENKTVVLSEISYLNQYAIKLQEGQQFFYGSIYNMEPLKLKTLKTYIEINLANSFI